MHSDMDCLPDVAACADEWDLFVPVVRPCDAVGTAGLDGSGGGWADADAEDGVSVERAGLAAMSTGPSSHPVMISANAIVYPAYLTLPLVSAYGSLQTMR
jgi:hypothetical protein